MTRDERIIEYLRSISRGMISVTPVQVKELIQIALGNRGGENAFCKLMRWSELLNCWEVLYTVNTTDEQIEARIREALNLPQVDKFYKWECYGSDHQLQGNIFTANTSLF